MRRQLRNRLAQRILHRAAHAPVAQFHHARRPGAGHELRIHIHRRHIVNDRRPLPPRRLPEQMPQQGRLPAPRKPLNTVTGGNNFAVCAIAPANSVFPPDQRRSRVIPSFVPRTIAALRALLAVLALTGAASPPKSEIPRPLPVAAAANLVYALDALNAEFKRSAPDITLTSTTGASGNFVAQIKNGAPFDVFLSADLDYPQALINAGQADAKTLTTFAIGRLVLWTTKPGIEVTDIAATVRNPAVQKLAVANPTTAPYGRAALQVLDRLGLTAVAQPKIVTGENITQTAQFVETGHADAGLVALSSRPLAETEGQGPLDRSPRRVARPTRPGRRRHQSRRRQSRRRPLPRIPQKRFCPQDLRALSATPSRRQGSPAIQH